MMKNISLVAASLLLAGCARTTPMVLGPNHPANPDAPVAAAPPRSTTLVVTNAPATASPPPAQSPAPSHAGHGAGPMDHAGHTAGSQSAAESPATQPDGQVVYACPMHPEVTSSNPNDRCPECNMKINKPVKKAAAPATPPAAPAGEHADHGSEHGGHR